MSHKLFVYGTLMSGYGNHRLIEGSTYVGEFLVDGSLYGFGVPGFCRAVPDQAEHSLGVIGEVYEIDDQALALCDRLEGHPTFYTRIEVEATSTNDEDSDPITVFIYEYPRAPDHGELIESGDYRDYRLPTNPQSSNRRYGINGDSSDSHPA